MSVALVFGDPTYWLFAIPGLLLGLWAQFKLSSAYGRYSQVRTDSGMSGAQAAREILDRAGLHDMDVHEVPGHLTDHYDPRRKALFLSAENFHGRSLAAVGVAAHEAGHALQHKAAYAPLQLRMAMVPLTGFASNAFLILFLIGMMLGAAKLILAAIVLYAVTTLFQVVTLPVEFDASRRAKEQLIRLGIVGSHETGAVGKVLNAAALTYVAAMVSSMLQLLYFISIFRGSDRE